MNNKIKHSITLIGCLGVLVSFEVNGFWIGVDSLGIQAVHQDITREALDANGYSYTLNNDVLTFNDDIIKKIIEGNVSIDEDLNTKYDAEYHCDDEMLTACDRRIRTRKDKIAQTVRNLVNNNNIQSISAAQKEMWSEMGKALHTLQDFYSHTSWININPSVEPNFGNEGFTYTRPSSTCEADSTTLLRPIPTIIPELTSGYYVKNRFPAYEYICTDGEVARGECLPNTLVQPLSYNAPFIISVTTPPVTKCVHGNFCNGHPTQVLCGNILAGGFYGTGYEGLHKDSPFRQDTFNARGEAHDHSTARQVAVLATREFVNNVINKIKEIIPDEQKQTWAIKALFGTYYLDLDSDGDFDEIDLQQWVNIFDAAADSSTALVQDFGRHDLNGDGYTGSRYTEEPGTYFYEISYKTGSFDSSKVAPLDLDGDGEFLTIQVTMGGKTIELDENALTDSDVLCYYTFSDQYTGVDPMPIVAGLCGLYDISVGNYHPSYTNLTEDFAIQPYGRATFYNSKSEVMGIKLDGNLVTIFEVSYDPFEYQYWSVYVPQVPFTATDQYLGRKVVRFYDYTNNSNVFIPVDLTISNEVYRRIVGRTLTISNERWGMENATISFRSDLTYSVIYRTSAGSEVTDIPDGTYSFFIGGFDTYTPCIGVKKDVGGIALNQSDLAVSFWPYPDYFLVHEDGTYDDHQYNCPDNVNYYQIN